MDPTQIINELYGDSPAGRLVASHGRQVADKALAVAGRVPHLAPDLTFIETAALLHDIGIRWTRAPELDCNGTEPYICHGVRGREYLEQIGLARYGLVCERHVGVGIAAADIRQHRMPLPVRDMIPETVEEEIICFADKFFSKNGGQLSDEKPVSQILVGLARYGRDRVERFCDWAERFREPLNGVR